MYVCVITYQVMHHLALIIIDVFVALFAAAPIHDLAQYTAP